MGSSFLGKIRALLFSPFVRMDRSSDNSSSSGRNTILYSLPRGISLSSQSTIQLHKSLLETSPELLSSSLSTVLIKRDVIDFTHPREREITLLIHSLSC